MKILIVSDTHGDDYNMWEAIAAEEPIDMLIHCGDIAHSVSDIEDEIGCPVHAVAGNNDFMLNLPQKDIFNIGKYRVLLMHGHQYNIYRDQSTLFYVARENNVDIVMFGHIHVPVLIEEEGITLVNPGSLTYPRQKGGSPSYIVMTVEDDKKPEYEIIYM